MNKILLVTDGGCSNNSYHGAWCALIVTPSAQDVIYGCLYPTTSSRCEILPVLEGLKRIYYDIGAKQAGLQVKLVSDNEHVVKTIMGLYEPKKNTDLWAAVGAMTRKMKVEAVWRSRNSHPYMEMCDCVAHAVRVLSLEHVHSAVLDTIKETGIPKLGAETI